MKLAELLNIVLNKDNFLTIEDYMEFSKQYLNFIKSGLQAVIVSKNENYYQFFQYKNDGAYNVTRPINSKLLYSFEEFEKLSADFVRLIENIHDLNLIKDSEPHCCKNFTLRSPLRERIPAYREGSACCHGCGIRDYPIAPAVRSGNVAQNALRACYAGTRLAFVKFFMQHWGPVSFREHAGARERGAAARLRLRF